MTVKLLLPSYISSSSSSSPSTSLNNMSSRDHPFNRSTRPLLAERKPQLLLKKKSDTTKLHGFNDFDIISQQYRNLNTHHIGYPYGSPPSPTANSDDFVFSDNTNSDFYNTSTPNRIYTTTNNGIDNNVSNGGSGGGGIVVGSNGNNGNGYLKNYHTDNDDDNNDRYNSSNNIKNNCKPLRIDGNNKKWRTNQISSSEHDSTGGPFIFGVHTVNNTFKENNTTVINSTKYSADKGKPVVINQSSSDTSSSSRDTDKECKVLVKHRKGTKKKNCKEKSNSRRKSRPRIKCVLVGDGAVGKTNLIVSYLENRFIKEHIPTASDIYNAEVMVNDSPVQITICDTAGQDSLDPLRELCYPDSDVFLLCFSVIKPETFRSIKTKWTPKFSKSKAALILVGTQADLRNDRHVLNKLQIQGEKPISFTDAWDLATSIGANYIETSSFTQDKVKDVFDAAIWDALLPNHLPPTPPLWKKLLCLV